MSDFATPKTKAVLVLLTSIAFAISPVFTAPFTGFDPAFFTTTLERPPVQPAGYAFSIWGLIYIWLIAAAVFGWLKRREDAGWDATRLPLLVSTGIGATWIAVANTSPIAATLLIFAMLITALMALFRAPISDKYWLRAPLGLYAGWLSAASFVSLATILAGYGIFSREAAGWLGLLGALAVAVTLANNLRAPGYGIAVIWALIGIIVAQWQSDTLLAGAAAGGAVAVLTYTLRPRAAA